MFHDDLHDESRRKQNKFYNEFDVNFLPQQTEKQTKRGGNSRGKHTTYRTHVHHSKLLPYNKEWVRFLSQIAIFRNMKSTRENHTMDKYSSNIFVLCSDDEELSPFQSTKCDKEFIQRRANSEIFQNDCNISAANTQKV